MATLEHHDGIDGPAVDDELVEEENPQNLLDQLRSDRKESMEHLDTLIPVPGYDAVPLLIQYKMMDGHELNKIAKKAMKQSRDQWTRSLTAAIDTMIAACTGVFVEVNGEVRPLTLNGQAITGYSAQLAEALGIEKAETARQVVIGTFQNKDLQIANHSVRLQRWFGDSTVAVDEEFLGE
jgi:hypothetical protein